MSITEDLAIALDDIDSGDGLTIKQSVIQAIQALEEEISTLLGDLYQFSERIDNANDIIDRANGIVRVYHESQTKIQQLETAINRQSSNLDRIAKRVTTLTHKAKKLASRINASDTIITTTETAINSRT